MQLIWCPNIGDKPNNFTCIIAMSDHLEITDISKLKVADLKKELKNRGLSTAGNKTELSERLTLAVTGDGIEESVMADSLLDEDEVLNDDVELDEDDVDDNEEKTIDEEALISPKSPTTEMFSVKRPISSMTYIRKIVLDRTPVIRPPSPTDITGAENLKENKAEKETIPDGPTEKKVIKLHILNEKERKELRAQKFGAPTTVSVASDAKKEARAERFGLGKSETSKASISNNKVDTSLEILKNRAERFGAAVSTTLIAAERQNKLEQRKARFGGTKDLTTTIAKTVKTTVDIGVAKTGNGVSNAEKAKLRLERFKTEVK